MGYNLSENIIKSIQNISTNFAIEKVVLFGSRARGDAMPTSDIDLAVYPSPEFKNRGYFTSSIDDLNTLLKIDLVFINDQTEPKLVENIRKDGVVIYERLQNEAR